MAVDMSCQHRGVAWRCPKHHKVVACVFCGQLIEQGGLPRSNLRELIDATDLDDHEVFEVARNAGLGGGDTNFGQSAKKLFLVFDPVAAQKVGDSGLAVVFIQRILTGSLHFIHK